MRMYHRGEIPPMDGDRSQGKSFPPRPPKSGQQEKRGRQPRPRRMQKRRKPRLGKGIVTTTTTYLHHRSDKYPPPRPLVVTCRFTTVTSQRFLIDTGSTVNLIFLETLDRMGVEQESIKPTSRPLTGFTAEYTYSCGTVRLPVYVGGISKLLKFIVMDKPAIYNAILGTPWLHEMKAVVSTFHQCVKFPTPSGIYTLRGDQRVTRSCFLRERKLRTASSFMIAEPSNQPPREDLSQYCTTRPTDSIQLDTSPRRWEKHRHFRSKRRTRMEIRLKVQP
ncbi:unnamed protein product [Microthlaspi erraticum]|uniref:Peptidase A2 domain-containing protein n=1 Tax=Microthlaspi erraticum TaxID=1685480 RepID=A0A6D2HY55_9BRAS|nr:unnamed protein product [Microthlaspi erraticum]